MYRRRVFARSTGAFRFRILWTFAALLLLAACSGSETDTDGDTSPDGDGESQPDGDSSEGIDEEPDVEIEGESAPEEEEESPALDDCGRAILVVPVGCDGCHGAPPTGANHPASNRCYVCHGEVIDENFGAVQAELHENGTVNTSMTCSACHGLGSDFAPPQDLAGSCDPTSRGNGVHAAHKGYCVECHVVPPTDEAEGHLDGDNRAEVVFSGLATTGGLTPAWNAETGTCSAVYCHGESLDGGTLKTPTWDDTTGQASACGACHALEDPSGHTDADCHSCHSTSVDENQTIIPGGSHLNGVKD